VQAKGGLRSPGGVGVGECVGYRCGGMRNYRGVCW
jgi:hypothetical protein